MKLIQKLNFFIFPCVLFFFLGCEGKEKAKDYNINDPLKSAIVIKNTSDYFKIVSVKLFDGINFKELDDYTLIEESRVYNIDPGEYKIYVTMEGFGRKSNNSYLTYQQYAKTEIVSEYFNLKKSRAKIVNIYGGSFINLPPPYPPARLYSPPNIEIQNRNFLDLIRNKFRITILLPFKKHGYIESRT